MAERKAKFDWDTRRRSTWTVPGTDATFDLVEMPGLKFHELNGLETGERIERLIRGSLYNGTGKPVLESDEDAAEFFQKLGARGLHGLMEKVSEIHGFDLGNSPASADE